MSTLDEITKEKQRLGAALARVDAQREKLTGQLGELEATERVIARYSKGTAAKKTASAKTPTTTTKAVAAARPRRRPRTTAAKPAGGKRTSRPAAGARVHRRHVASAGGRHCQVRAHTREYTLSVYIALILARSPAMPSRRARVIGSR